MFSLNVYYTLVGLGTELVGKIYNRFKNKQQAAQAAEFYTKKYCDRYGQNSNLLIIKSKKAASRVLQKTWNDIESRMLLPVK